MINVDLSRVLVLDVETVPVNNEFNALSPQLQQLWKDKSLRVEPDRLPDETFFERAAIYAEFGKIVCISAGIFIPQSEEESLQFKVKSFYHHNEKELLQEFAEMLNGHYPNPANFFFCGHNIKEFDIPYIARRMLVNRISLPNALRLHDKKPWDVNHLDTMQMWRFGDYKSFTSLKLLTEIFNIPTPKDDIDGSMVAHVYWKENDLERIVKYCSKDVVATAQLLLAYMNKMPLKDENVSFKEDDVV